MAKARRRKEDLVTETPPSGYPVREAPLTGPSDSSDSASDLVGTGLDGSSDRQGTGERATAGRVMTAPCDSELAPDRVVGETDAGLGGGLDQAEEAQLGITDEEIEEREEHGRELD
jgi:hypothetical protein